MLAEQAVPAAAQIAVTPEGVEVPMPMTDAQMARAKKINIGGAKGQGFFDRMFDLPPLTATENDLEALANAMIDVNPNSPALDNQTIPAGFTYLGQFIDHDISLDLSPLSAKQEDPTMIENFRTPGLDLDCLYGAGPGPHRFLYRQDAPKFLIGTADASPDVAGQPQIPSLPNDLERGRQGVALIGDHRNDENLVVAQTHLALLKFHNKVVDHHRATTHAGRSSSRGTSKLVRWHYQWMVLHDFVERLTEPGIVNKLLTEGRKFYRFKSVPFMPVEFAGAAYRLGHSMVREEYSHNHVFRPNLPRLAEGSLEFLFRFSGLSGIITGELGGLPRLPSNWVIDWRRFFNFNTPPATPNFEFNHSRKLDPFLTPLLHNLPGFPEGTGSQPRIPKPAARRDPRPPEWAGLANEMKKKVPSITPLTPAEIATGPDGAVAAQKGFDTKTPLWYYILKEAQVRGNGERLGPVGARIVAEVFVGLVQGDADSFLSQPGWTPTLPAKTAGNVQHDRPAAVRWRHQPDRWDHDGADAVRRALRARRFQLSAFGALARRYVTIAVVVAMVMTAIVTDFQLPLEQHAAASVRQHAVPDRGPHATAGLAQLGFELCRVSRLDDLELVAFR